MAGCGKKQTKYLTNGPFFLKGLKEIKLGNESEAERFFLKDLAQQKSYAGHLQLIFIYEHQSKYPETIVHCNQYLQKATKNDQNLDMVREIKRDVLKSLQRQLNLKYKTKQQPTVKKSKYEPIFRKKWYQAIARERRLKEKLATLKSELALTEFIEEPNNTKKTSLSKKSVSKQIKSSVSAKTYRVVKGDSLSVISMKIYGTSRRWREIQEANLPALDNPNKLRVGQIINLPQDQKKIETPKPAKVAKKSVTKKKISKATKKVIKPAPPKGFTSKPIGEKNIIMPRLRKE
jgi:LysM repeat protein